MNLTGWWSGFMVERWMSHTIGLDGIESDSYNFKSNHWQACGSQLVNHSLLQSWWSTIRNRSITIVTLFSQFLYTGNWRYDPTKCWVLEIAGLDFTSSTVIRWQQKKVLDGAYDHNILDRSNNEGEYHYAAELYDPKSGRAMTLLTTQPAVQFYNASKLSNNNTWLGQK